MLDVFLKKNNSMKNIRYNVQGVQKYLVQITHPLELALLKGVSSKKEYTNYIFYSRVLYDVKKIISFLKHTE